MDILQVTERINDDIVQVVEHYAVDLKRSGSNYKACCPFHNEKTPSFMVSPTKGIYKCFGCGKAGDAISFIQHQEGIQTRQGADFIEILKTGSKIFNIDFQPRPLTDLEREDLKKKEGLKIIHAEVTKYYQSNLEKEKYAYKYVKDRIIPKLNTNCCVLPPAKRYKEEVETISTKLYTYNAIIEDSFDEDFNAFLEVWQLGWASSHKLLDFTKRRAIKNDSLIDSGIVRHHRSTNHFYDFFSERLIFPIFDIYGNPIAFSARTLTNDKAIAKFKNSPDTLIFNKGENLYGIHTAKKHIKENDGANLLEGNFDVLRLHWLGIENTIAGLGTALTEKQIEIIKRYTNNITLIYDGDQAGKNALKKNGEALLKASMNVYLIELPNGEDPGSFFYSKEQFINYEKKHKQDFLLYTAVQLFSEAHEDVRKRQKAIETIVKMLYPMKELTRNLYIQELMKISGTKVKEWSSLIIKKNKEESLKNKGGSLDYIKGMTDEQEEMLEQYNFYYSSDNQMYFKAKKEDMPKLKGRFTIYPLYHIEGDNGDVRKLFKVKNYRNEEKLLETDIGSLQSTIKLSELLEKKGNFVFEGEKLDLLRLKRWLYDNTKYSRAVSVPGWQKQGFWAWAEGIIDKEGSFIETDEYGIVNFENQFFYIPAFSILNENSNEFEEIRKFSYSIQTITLKQWSKLMLEVYGNNAMLSIASYTAALFSDHIFNITRSLPLINFFGPKGSGKTEHGFSISALFGQRLKELNINNATQSRLSNFVNDFRNAMVLIDEYKNSLHPSMIESLKMLWNRQIRGRNTLNGNNKIVADNSIAVNSMIMIAGQEMMTADIALFSRAIFIPSYKTKYEPEEKQKFRELKEIQDKGLAHFTSKIVTLRVVFEKAFSKEFDNVSRELKAKANPDIEERLIQNHAIVLTAFKLVSEYLPKLQDKDQFAFTYEQLLSESIRNLEQQYKLMTSSNEISGFFKVLTFMFERGLIKDESNFKIKTCTSVGDINFEDVTTVLFLRWEGIYQHYAEIGKKTGENVMPEESLRYYLENSSVFLQRHKTRFKGIGVRNAMCFNYKTCESYGLFLTRDTSELNETDTDETITEVAQDDLPF